MSQIHSHSPEEVQLLALLREVQSVLSNALNSLDSNSFAKPETRYLGWAAVTVNRAADGYLMLRESYRVDASKLLIRPILEAFFSAAAVMKKRGFLFRKTYTEILEEKKFHPKNSATETDFQRILKEMEQLFKKDDPIYPIEHKRVDVRYTAQVAEMLPVYEVAYSTYCLFTHGAISAATGQLNKSTDDLDTQFVVRLVIMMLELLQKYTPAKIPDMASFLSRLPTPQLRGVTQRQWIT